MTIAPARSPSRYWGATAARPAPYGSARARSAAAAGGSNRASSRSSRSIRRVRAGAQERGRGVREPGGPRRGHVDDARVGDRGHRPPLGGERARHPEAALADADDGDPRPVDVPARDHRVEHRRQHRLPVRPQVQPLLEPGGLLARAVVGHPVIAALGRRGAAARPHLRRGGVGPVGHHDQRARLAGRRVGGGEEGARQRRARVGDREALGGNREQRGGAVPARALAPPQREPPAGLRRAVDQAERRRVVRRRPEQVRAGADAAPLAGRRGRGRPRRAGGRDPFEHPRVRVAVLDPGGGGERLADVGGAAPGAAEDVGERAPELVVVEGRDRHGDRGWTRNRRRASVPDYGTCAGALRTRRARDRPRA